MHELSVITHLAKTIEEIAEENHLTKVGSVTLEYGEVTAIVPELMNDCWNYYRKKFPLIQDAELKMVVTPAVTYCEDCGKTYPTVQYGKICPYCGSEHTYLIRGLEYNIREMEAE